MVSSLKKMHEEISSRIQNYIQYNFIIVDKTKLLQVSGRYMFKVDFSEGNRGHLKLEGYETPRIECGVFFV